MRYKVLIDIAFFTALIITCAGIGISSKLDFGESSPKLIGTASQYRSISTPYKHLGKEDTKTSDFEGIGIVCVSGGCNKTRSNESKDSIQTDVIVHVKTSVDVNKNKSTVIDDTPDVPIIVGTAGIKQEDSQARSFDQTPLVVTDFGDAFSQVGPSLGSSLTPSVTPSFVPSYSSYSTPTLQSGNVYVPQPDLSSEPRVDINIKTLPPQSDNVYGYQPNLSAEPHVDINIKTLPPITLTKTDDGQRFKDISYKANGIELRIPYFEPSYQNHYFGENPPPQYVWYPKRPGLTDSVEYKPKATWKPSFWSAGTTHKHAPGNGDSCPCKNQPATGLQWYPNRRRYDDPGSQINDKLAPLN